MDYTLTQQAIKCFDEIIENVKKCPVCEKQYEWLKKDIHEIKKYQFSVAEYEKKLSKILASMNRHIETSSNCEAFAFLHMKLLHIFENRFFIEKK